jgi:hypothetical protein
MLPTQDQIIALLARIHLFRGLSPQKLAVAAKCVRAVEYPSDAYIFKQGHRADEFFFVFSGRVKMERKLRGGHDVRMLGFLDEGDFFGGETFEENQPRRVSVQAITPVTLLTLNIKQARRLVDEVPEFDLRVSLALDNYRLMLRNFFPWINPEEYIYYVARKHPIFLWLRLLPWAFFGLLGLGLLLGLLPLQNVTLFLLIIGMGLLVILGGLVWHYVDWANDYFIVTGRRVIYQERVVLLYDSRQESPLEQLQSLSVDSSQIGRIFNYGNLTMRTFTGTILFQAIRRPQEVLALVQELQKRTQSSLRQAELRQIETTLRQRFSNAQPKPPPPPVEAKTDTRVSRIQRFMADLFHLRYETGDTIQYRTHWWILARRIWLPSLLVLADVGVIVWIIVRSIVGLMSNFPVVGAFMGLCLLFLVFALWWLYIYLDWHNDIYLITSEQVIDINRKPLGKEEKRAAQIKNILSIEYKRLGITGLILNFGTVFIRVGEADFTFDDVFNPSEVQRELFHRMAQRSLRERQAQGEAERQRMADWLTVYHRMTHPQE